MLGSQYFHYVTISEVLCVSKKPDLQSQAFIFPLLYPYILSVAEAFRYLSGAGFSLARSESLCTDTIKLHRRITFGLFYLEKLCISDPILLLNFFEVSLKKNPKQWNTNLQKFKMGGFF